MNSLWIQNEFIFYSDEFSFYSDFFHFLFIMNSLWIHSEVLYPHYEFIMNSEWTSLWIRNELQNEINFNSKMFFINKIIFFINCMVGHVLEQSQKKFPLILNLYLWGEKTLYFAFQNFQYNNVCVEYHCEL